MDLSTLGLPMNQDKRDETPGTRQQSVRPKEQSGLPDSSTTTGKSSKKRMHVIPSRYLQQADNSVLQRRHTSRSEVRKHKAVTPCSTTTSNKSVVVVSTPASSSSSCPSFDDGDVSVIAPPNKTICNVPTVKTALVPQIKTSRKQLDFKNDKTVSDAFSAGKARFQLASAERDVIKPKTIDPDYCEIIYSQKVLAESLLVMRQKSLEENTKQSLYRLWSLSCLNRELMEQKRALVEELQKKQYLLNTQKLLAEQNEVLEKEMPELMLMEKQYCSIANCLDVCQSEIPTENVILPKNQEDLIPLLRELDSGLDKFLQDTEKAADKIKTMATNVKNIQTSSVHAQQTGKRLETLLNELKVKSTREASLIVLVIQEALLEKLKERLFDAGLKKFASQ